MLTRVFLSVFITVTGTPTEVFLKRTSLNKIELETFTVLPESPAVKGHYAYLTQLGTTDTQFLDFMPGRERLIEISNENVGNLFQLWLIAVSDTENTLTSAISEAFVLDFCEKCSEFKYDIIKFICYGAAQRRHIKFMTDITSLKIKHIMT